jgi:predicted RNase H-like HicB family nuclease
MLYPIAIEPGDEAHAFGVVVPDIPGCFSAGDTLDEAIANAREAIELHLEGLAEEDSDIPVAGAVAQHQASPDYAGWIWAVIDVDVTR